MKVGKCYLCFRFKGIDINQNGEILSIEKEVVSFRPEHTSVKFKLKKDQIHKCLQSEVK